MMFNFETEIFIYFGIFSLLLNNKLVIMSGKNPTCMYGHEVHSVCMNPTCKRPAFICEKGVSQNNECSLFHQYCQKMQWHQFQSVINENPNSKSQQFEDFVRKMDDLFVKVVQTVQFEHANFKLWVRTFGYSLQVMKLFKMFSDRSFDSITGSDLNLIFNARFNKQKQIQVPSILDSELKQVSFGIEHLFQRISGLYLGKKSKIQLMTTSSSPLFDSKVTQDINTINSFFDQSTIKKATLLYRASQNDFSVAKFHKTCDNVHNTLVLLTTEFGKIIGGFTPLMWNSSSKHWSEDKSMKSFIFSVSMKEKFQLNLSQFAIACNPGKGPIFGCCDLCIVDKADKQKSNAEFPISYNNGKYTRGQNTYMAFTGHPKGQFLVKEWEIFKVEF